MTIGAAVGAALLIIVGVIIFIIIIAVIASYCKRRRKGKNSKDNPAVAYRNNGVHIEGLSIQGGSNVE